VRKFLLRHSVTKGMLLSMTIKGLSPRGAPADDAPGGAGTEWRTSPRFNAFNKEN
jgi:hypothetical protein